jgi:hypothetical protein
MSSRDLQVDAEPPRIVFESPAPCRDADRAEKLLHDALSSSRAPGAGWLVTMRVERDAQKHLKATARIDDGDGVSVADRSLDGEGPECAGLAKAVGVWAGLVLDSRMQAAASLEQPPPAAPASPVSGTSATPSPPSTTVAPSTTPEAGWPAPAQPEAKTPEHDWYLHHDAGQGRTFELGAGTFIMTGTGGGALAGPTIFAVIEGGNGIFFRPALAFGGSLTSLPPSDVKSSMWGAGRMDACLRLPGLYTRRKGMQLDLCGGTEVGVTSLDSGTTTTLPYWAIGPSIDLRGELASSFSAVLRMVAGIEVLREQFTDLNGDNENVPLVTGRLELALSWDLR